MRIFGWVQNKLHGSKKLSPISVDYHTQKEHRNQEFGDLPYRLLAIGTFGNNDMKEEKSRTKFVQKTSSQDYFEELTPEEVQKIHHELNLILHKQDGSISGTGSEINKPVNGNPSLEDDQECSSYSVVVGNGRGKGLHLDNTSKAISKKSLSFLLKKMFVCRGGFTPTPSLRDQVPESRMEKILRTILHNKIYPQNPSSTSLTKKYLENKYKASSDSEDEEDDKDDDNGSKWVKTDSEYIVLEI